VDVAEDRLTRRGLPIDRELRVLAIGSFATRLGGGAVMSTSAVYFTRHLGFSAAEVAVALSVAGLASLLAALPAGHLGDVRGPREVLTRVMIGLAIVTPLPALARSPLILAVALGLEAALASSANAVRNGIIAQIARGGRGVAFKAYLRAVTNAAIAGGSLVGGLALVLDTDAAYRLSGVPASQTEHAYAAGSRPARAGHGASCSPNQSNGTPEPPRTCIAGSKAGAAS
jgi:predicted MFS family arabinose efflux permease